MEVVARGATLADLADLVRMDTALRDSYQSLRGGALYILRNHRQRPVDASYVHDIADDDAVVLIGSLDEVVAGFGAARIVELEGGYRLVELTEIFVDPEMREVGIGAAIMGQILEWAESKSADGIDSHAMPGDRSTKNFFESNGLVARAIKVHKDLRAP
ncbi:MAG: GNAT family N-acetyltransferase [Microthrixaceae bacterium]